ncbi:unnamed protein product [Larinioides sclopetarius]|uniref:Uncharacterized protein n=1 Tax=Larinioides sclopetarius TaxID=280406 RepID=A0AAV2BIA0_9ARAC
MALLQMVQIRKNDLKALRPSSVQKPRQHSVKVTSTRQTLGDGKRISLSVFSCEFFLLGALTDLYELEVRESSELDLPINFDMAGGVQCAFPGTHKNGVQPKLPFIGEDYVVEA